MSQGIALPQNAAAQQQDQRRRTLARRQVRYRYDHDYLAPLPVVRGLPFSEFFSPSYLLRQGQGLTVMAANLFVAKVWSLFDRFDKLQDFEDLFPLLPKPASLGRYRDDAEFGRQRLAGVNPMVVHRIAALPPTFPLSETRFQEVVGPGKTIQGEAQAGRLYLADYAILDGMPVGTFRGRQKHLVAPLALFHWTQAGLMPVAIQLGQQPGPGRPIFTPRDGAAWFVAKTLVQVAETTHHEMVTHLGRTHLLIEPFILATARQLAPTHPLAVLLKPHFRFTLAINKAAKYLLINKGGFVDRLFAGTLEGTLSIAGKSRPTNFYDLALPTELRSRGVDDAALLPEYPYRDDALLIWEAVGAFVKEYLGLYYGTDGDVVNDYELQQWFRELTDTLGGRLRGVTRSGQLQTRTELADLITQLVFTCGPQHAAVNFPQYDYIAFTPNMPAAVYSAPPTDAASVSAADVLKVLPPRSQASGQLLIVRALTAFRTERLGDYGSGSLGNPQAGPVIERFRVKLHDVESRINQRNQQRAHPYVYLKPSMIPNSTSI